MLILYSTQGCHLCEQAYAMLESLSLDKVTQVVDIAYDDDLYSRYGLTIPVLSIAFISHSEEVSANHHSVQSELGWPFNLDELQAWLKNTWR